ncbi:hypothetical protein OIU14_08235 [Thalassobacter stenotrophicus]|uniref:DUF7220 family protein n=1 Tax=Thalassobacter stenotrophicus TaxID=266809 RepID=UPI0022A8FA86|nr:hypothetical protein [Thalassobacter stenotrophicus]UYP69691.1 hypothetical protein OIU14_08235 [Thalassobacter stenotrophicus]
MMQSRHRSLIEAITNIVVGYLLAIITQIIVFPRFVLQATLGENLAIGMIFVGLSLLRSYALPGFLCALYKKGTSRSWF